MLGSKQQRREGKGEGERESSRKSEVAERSVFSPPTSSKKKIGGTLVGPPWSSPIRLYRKTVERGTKRREKNKRDERECQRERDLSVFPHA